jgi:hypothetical protein
VTGDLDAIFCIPKPTYIYYAVVSQGLWEISASGCSDALGIMSL